MKTISFTEFRKNASDFLDLVEKGAIIRITRHGRAIAKIVPAESRDNDLSWKRPCVRLVVKGVSISRAILDERRSSR